MTTTHGGGWMSVRVRRGHVIRLGNGVLIEVARVGDGAARMAIYAPPDIKIVLERGIRSPFHDVDTSGM